jgi:hypothetical protein
MKIIRLTEGDLHNIVTEVVANLCESSTSEVVFHCGDELNERRFKDVIWFSSEPIGYFGYPHRYEVTMNNPLVINAFGAGWNDKLWRECCKPTGEPKCPPDDPSLVSRAPAFIWKMVQESDDEIEYGDIPYIVKHMRNEGKVNYDGVIIKEIYETPTCNIKTDDYVVFSMKQIKLVK